MTGKLTRTTAQLARRNQREEFNHNQQHAAGAADADTSAGGEFRDSCGELFKKVSGTNNRSWIVDVETTFLRYNRADGVQNQFSSTPLDFGYEAAPRVTIGFENDDHSGLRVRYWDYSHQSGGGANIIGVDTFTIDTEFFTIHQLNQRTTMEFSTGIRYVDFSEQLYFFNNVTENTSLSGPGGIFGLQLNRETFFGGEWFVRGRGSLLMADKKISPGPVTTLADSTHTMTELSMGYQASRCLKCGAVASLRVGLEWQHFSDFSVAQNLGGDTSSDVGFSGFFIGTGLKY